MKSFIWCSRSSANKTVLSATVRLLQLQFNQNRSTHLSSIYRPVNVTPPLGKPNSGKQPLKSKDEALSKSLRLLVDNGLIKQSSCVGAYHLLPLALKAMEKLISLVDCHMTELQNCHKIQMPTLTSSSLWKETGRLEECRAELMRIQDRHSKEYLLSPTHEEAICDLLRNPTLSYRQLPQRLYQITEKFRDEHRPRFGLLRARQFIMKDLYTFDTTLDAAKATYLEVNEIYRKLLNSLDLNWVQAEGSTGTIGGILSDEFHILSEVGEDSIIQCNSCQHSINKDLLEAQEQENQKVSANAEGSSSHVSQPSQAHSPPKCSNCGSSYHRSSRTAIEVGHSFLLGTKYTQALTTVYINENGQKVPMEMGCYGLGVSRLLAASLEIKSSQDELRWPLRIAPYVVCVIPPKRGSKEEEVGERVALKLYELLSKMLPKDVLYDDRTNLTIGKRLQDIKRLGIPYVIVCGKDTINALEPRMEFFSVYAQKHYTENLDNILKLMYDVKSEINLKP